MLHNGFWAGIIASYDRRGEDLRLVDDYEALVAGLNAARLHAAAKRWLQLDRHVLVTLKPEGVAARSGAAPEVVRAVAERAGAGTIP